MLTNAIVFFLYKLASLTSKMAFLVNGKRLEKRSTPNLPMVIIQQLATVSRPNNRETGGLEDMRTDHLKLHQLEELSEIDPTERLLPRPLRSLANASRS